MKKTSQKMRAKSHQLPESVQTYLDEITSKQVSDLTAYEVRFLRARVSYLTSDDKEFYKDVLSGAVVGNAVEEKPVVLTRKVIDPKEYKLEVLQQMAKDAELAVTPEMTKAEIADMLNNR
jgi:hypothetical protein